MAKFKKGDKIIHKDNKKRKFVIEDIIEDAYILKDDGMHSIEYIDEFYELDK